MLYDSRMNLTQVTDPYNNKLTLERKFHEATAGTTQTVEESRLVTKVSYANAGQAPSQVAEFKYQSYDVATPSTGVKSKVYTLIESSSTGAGKNTYVNALTELGAMKAFVASKGRTADASYYYPVLKQVKNALSQVVRQWDVTQNYLLATDGTYSTAQTTLRSFTPNTTGTAYDNTSVYNDIARSITTSIALGSTTGSNTTQTTLDSSSASKITISSSGYPCLIAGKNTISSAEFNTERGRLSKITDTNNIVSSYSYDTRGRLTTATEAVGNTLSRTTSYVYGVLVNNTVNPFTVPTEVKTSNVTIKNVVDTNGNITSQTQTSSQSGSTSKVTSYIYFSDATKPYYALLASVDGPRTGTADKISYTYDGFGNLASQSQTINGAIRTKSYIGYNTFTQPERIVNPNGLVEQFVYNADGTVKTKTVGAGASTGTITGQTTTYSYDALKRIISEKSPDGEVTSYQYNLAGQTSVVVLPNGNKTTYSYFPVGITASEVQTNSVNAVFNQNYTQLDIKGRVAKQYSGNNANQLYTSYIYDNNGNLIQIGSAQGITERWTYDALNRVKTHTDGMGNVDIKDYDNLDNIILAKDALNAGSNPLTYRNGSILTQEFNTDFGTKTYSYNEADQLTQRIHSARKCNYNNIDESGRYRAFVCTANSGTAANEYQINDNYTYDQSRFGRLDKVTSSIAGLDVNTNYTYDAYDRITKKSQVNLLANRWLNTANQSLNVNYSYSLAGKRTSLTLPSGRVVTYGYNLATGTLTGINLNNSALLRGISYDGANRITGWLWGASGTASYGLTYANNGLLNSIVNKNNSAVNYSLSYGYDADGRITSIARNNGMKDSFTYDAADRLTSENRLNGSTSAYSITYTYDNNGNRISLRTTGAHAQPSASVNYIYTGNKLSTLNKAGTAQPLTYTANADVAFGAYKAAYDNGGRRKADHGTGHYYYMNYNHKNERNTRGYVTNNAASNVIQYVYDEESHLIGEYSGATPVVEYVWLGNKPVAAIYGSGAATKIYYIVTDHLNTPRRLVESSNQAIVWSWDSTAFGVGTPVSSVTFNLRFPGQYYDVGTGQFYNHNRFYNPELGRYMEPDPIGLEGGLNPYAYAGSNPVMNSDASGLLLTSIEDIALSNIKGIENSINNWDFLLNSMNYQPSLPTVASANKNLKINGGSGNNVQVDASRIRVEPNGGKQWELNKTYNRYQLTVRATGWKNDAGQWIDEGWNSVPTQSSRAYWVYGELTLSDNLKLYNDPYDFEYHSLSDASSITGKAGIIGRNVLTYVGAKNAGTPPGAAGYKHEFYNTPYCPTCPPLPKKK